MPKPNDRELSTLNPTEESLAYIIKVVRNDWNFIFSMGPHDPIKWPLRTEARKRAYTQSADGSTPRIGRESHFRGNKGESSKPQSVTVIQAGITVSRFNPGSGNNIGMIAPFDPKNVTRKWKHDVGSKARPFDSDAPKEYAEKKRQFGTIESLFEAFQESEPGSRYNECFARIRWDDNHHVAIFTKPDQATIHEKLRAQWFSHTIMARHGVRKPIIVFVDLNTKEHSFELTRYTEEEQEQDLQSHPEHFRTAAVRQWQSYLNPHATEESLKITTEKLIESINSNQSFVSERDEMVLQLAFSITPTENTMDFSVIQDNLFTPTALASRTDGLLANHATHLLVIAQSRRLRVSEETMDRIRPNLIHDLIRSTTSTPLHERVKKALRYHLSDETLTEYLQEAASIAARSNIDYALIVFLSEQSLRNWLYNSDMFEMKWPYMFGGWRPGIAAIPAALHPPYPPLTTIEKYPRSFSALLVALCALCALSAMIFATSYPHGSSDKTDCLPSDDDMLLDLDSIEHNSSAIERCDDSGIAAIMAIIIIISNAALLWPWHLLKGLRSSNNHDSVNILIDCLVNPPRRTQALVQNTFSILAKNPTKREMFTQKLGEMIRTSQNPELAQGHIRDTLALAKHSDLQSYYESLSAVCEPTTSIYEDDDPLLEDGYNPHQLLAQCIGSMLETPTADRDLAPGF